MNNQGKDRIVSSTIDFESINKLPFAEQLVILRAAVEVDRTLLGQREFGDWAEAHVKELLAATTPKPEEDDNGPTT
jgi:hypothetical protein